MRRSKSPSEAHKDLFKRTTGKIAQEHCCVCRGLANFAYREEGQERVWYCANHVPEHFGIPASVYRMIEDQFFKNTSTGSAPNAPADEVVCPF